MKNTIIFQENDPSNDKFYIILSGTVKIVTQKKENVYIDENKKENNKFLDQIQRKKTLNNLNSAVISSKKFSLMTNFDNISSMNNNTVDKDKAQLPQNASPLRKIRKKNISIEEILSKQNSVENFDEKLKSFGYILNELSKGESFGEKALLGEAGKRTATVIASTDVELLIIKKKNFLEITQKFNFEKERKRNFLMGVLPFLKSIRSISNLENLLYCFKEENIPLGFLVTEEDNIDSDEKIYFLIEGRCKVERKFIEIHENQTLMNQHQITEVVAGSIIGEEILFEEEPIHKYRVTVKFLSSHYNF